MTSGPSVSSTFGVRSEGRKNNFDFLRFVLATAVIYHHSFDLLLGHLGAHNSYIFLPSCRDTLSQLTGQQMDLGVLSVNYFFAISGFLITASWLHGKSLIDYCRKRFLRIYPGYAAAILACAFIIGPLSVSAPLLYLRNHDTYRFLSALLTFQTGRSLPGIFSHVPLTGVVNGSLWTIPYEIICYALVAIMGVTASLRSRPMVFGLFIVWYGIYIARVHGISIPFVGTPDRLPRLLTYFLAGMVFYLFRYNIPYSKLLFAVSIAGILGGFLLHIGQFTFPIFGTYFLFCIAFSPELKMENFARHGDFSYGVYVYAWPVQQLLIQYWGRSLNPYTLFVTSWVIIVPIAAASWHFIEKPSLRLKGK
jgi:peptidoglycan/LPS O-acetylase OafA/YrhL